MLNACAFRVEQMSSIKCRCNRSFETDSCTSIPGRLHCKRPCTFAVGSRRGRRSQSPWELPSPRLQPSSSKDAVHVDRKLGLHVQRHVGSDKYLVGRYARARKTLPQDRCPADRSVRLPSNKLPEQTWRGRAREGPKRQESHVCSPPPRWEGRSVPCMSSSPCEGACELSRVDRLTWSYQGKHTAGTPCSDVVSQNGLKPWPERALHRSDHWS